MTPAQPQTAPVGQSGAKRSPASFGVLAFVLALVAFLMNAARFGFNGPPSANGDEASYDSIGWELSRGRGFSEDFQDSEFRRPYEAAARGSPDAFTLPRKKAGPVAYRPPAFPLLVAATNLGLGRQFWAIRLLNCAAVAAVCGLIVWFLARDGSVVTALTAWVLFVVLDTRTRLFARAIMSEATASLLVAVLAVLLIALHRDRHRVLAGCAGCVFGLAVLARTIFALWAPVVLPLVYAVVRFDGRSDAKAAVRRTLEFAAAAILVALPWAVRNIAVLAAFMPLGTQGLTELPAGFSDAAWERDGVWNLESRRKLTADLPEDLTTLEAEKASATIGRKAALQWIRRHPLKAILLMPLKLFHEHRPRTISEGALVVLVVIGFFSGVRRPDTRILSGLIVANALAVGLSWSVSGRFLVPLLFVLHVFAARGAVALGVFVQRRVSNHPVEGSS